MTTAGFVICVWFKTEWDVFSEQHAKEESDYFDIHDGNVSVTVAVFTVHLQWNEYRKDEAVVSAGACVQVWICALLGRLCVTAEMNLCSVVTVYLYRGLRLYCNCDNILINCSGCVFFSSSR